MTEQLPARRNKQNAYTPLEIEKALTVLAFSRGLKDAHETLKGTDVAPSIDSLRRWRDDLHTDLYLQICERTAAEREKIVTEEIVPVIRSGIQRAAKALDVLDAQLDAGEVKDPAGAARNAATVAAIFIDKKLALEGRPTSTIEHRNPAEILRLLAQRGRVQDVVEGSTEEDN